jgi:hypothetical protein
MVGDGRTVDWNTESATHETLFFTQEESFDMALELLAARKELEALRWRKITPDCLPKAGDELLCMRDGEIYDLMRTNINWESIDLIGVGVEYHRPLNPPQEDTDGKCPNCHDAEAGCSEFGCWKYTPEQEAKLRKDADAQE